MKQKGHQQPGQVVAMMLEGGGFEDADDGAVFGLFFARSARAQSHGLEAGPGSPPSLPGSDPVLGLGGTGDIRSCSGVGK